MVKLNVMSKWILASILLFGGYFLSFSADYPAGSPVALNGKLKVSGTQLVNECGNPIQLRGMSTHGPQWYGNCICSEMLDVLVDDWKIDVFRIAMYVQEQGYVTNPPKWKSFIDTYVDECANRGIYCLIDWHVLNPGNPMANLSDAKDFWDYMSKKHGSKKHVLFEICNEPNSGCSWSTVKEYAEDILKIIRTQNNDETVVIVGTPTWSQDVDIASQNKLNYSNVMYTLHFYAGTHGESLRKKAENALQNGCAIFITEFGTSSASGDNNYSPDATKTWINWANQNKISWVNWSYADKGEVSAALKERSCESKNWNNLTASGELIKGLITTNRMNYVACNNQQQQQEEQHQQQQEEQQEQQQEQQQQEQQQSAQCPELVSSIVNKKVYRIVNKNSCKVMTAESQQEKAKMVQKTRNEQDKGQWFVIESVSDDYYTIKNLGSSKVLSNSYNPNEGAETIQEDLSGYDNPTQKWKITKVDGTWFKIENKNLENSCLAVAESSNSDGASVVQNTQWSNGANQMWGFEYIEGASGITEIMSCDLSLVPTWVEEGFSIVGEEEYSSVNIYSLSGTLQTVYPKQSYYDISGYMSGTYFVVLQKNGVVLKRFTITKQ